MKLRSLFLLFFTLISTLSIAQDGILPDSNAREIELTRVTEEVLKTRRVVSSLESGSDLDINRFDSIVSKLNNDIDSGYERFEVATSGEVSRITLTNLTTQWKMIHARFEEAQTMIEDRHAEYIQKEAKLETEIQRWTNALSKVDKESTELKGRIQNLIKDLKGTKSDIEDLRISLEKLDSRLGEGIVKVIEVEEEISKLAQEQSRSIFVQNAVGIWDTHWDSTYSATKSDTSGYIGTLIDQNFIGVIRLDKNYIQENTENFHFHLLLWLITLFVVFRAQRKFKESSPFEYSDFASKSRDYIQRHPFLAACFLSIFYGAFLYESLPLYVKTSLYLVLIAILVSFEQDKPLLERIRLFITLSLILLIGKIEFITEYDSLLNRLLMISKVFIVWFLVERVSFSIKAKLVHHLSFLKKEHLQYLTVSFYVLLAVAIIGNLLGYIELARLCVLLVTQVVLATVIAYGALITIVGVSTYLISNTWDPKEEGGRKYVRDVLKYTEVGLTVLVGWFWLRGILTALGLYITFTDWFDTFFNEEIVAGNITFTLSEIALSLGVMLLTVAITRFIGFFVKEGGLNRLELKRGVPNAISLVIRYSLIFIGFVFSLSILGIDMSSFSLIAGALGVGIGFGLQNIIANFVSGLILVFERPIQEGDVVEVRSLLGEVNKIGVRSSNIRTFSGSEVIVPNELLISEDLINWTLSDSKKRIEVNVGVEYGSDPSHILDLLKQAANESPSILKDPEPIALFDEFGDSSLNFRLLIWVPQDKYLLIRSEVMVNVYDKLKAYNINIPFPIRTLKFDPADREKLSPKKEDGDD